MKNKNSYLPYLLPFRCFVFLVVFVMGAILTNKKIDEISNWWSIVASIVNVITILLLIFASKKIGSNYRDLINYQKGKTTIAQIVKMTVVILAVGMSGMYFAGYGYI